MKSAWGASILFCVRPEKSALFASKRWASGIRQKPYQIAHPVSTNPTARIVENLPLSSNMAVCEAASKPRRKLTGLRALYYRYLYELGALPRKPRRPSYAVRQDAYKLDQRIRQMEFLSKNNIDTLTAAGNSPTSLC